MLGLYLFSEKSGRRRTASHALCRITDTAEASLEMDASNVSVLSSSLAWPTCTSEALSSIHNNQSSKVDERKSPQAVVLNGISLPVVQIAQQEGQQAPFQLASGGASFAIENANLSVIFTPQPQTVLQKSPSQTITLNIMNNLPILNPNSPASLIGASPGKSKSIGKHICAHCGRDCLKPSVLEKHIRSHTGERPFPCNICGISFKTQSNLYKHRRTQTHVNNAKQSFDSDCGSYHEDKLHVGHNTCLDISSGTRDSCMDKSHFIQNKNLSGVLENDSLEGSKGEVSILSSVKIHDKSHGDSDYSSQAIFSPGMPNLHRTVIDPKSTGSSRHCQLQRQHETCVDKQWDPSPCERKLKKCESTDSGYLSHSDSADLQMFSGSPLHSLSECSIESEKMLGIGSVDSEDKITSSHKKNLEERISMLISQNKAVVDNTHLDNVRPRKTALSKQGSIDLPMPYTFKDSFHFDIKTLDANRKKVSSSSSKSTFTPSEKNKPLFFHSVPTQISTSIENIILTRSNSLPFVESGRLKDRLNVHNILSHGSGKQPLNVSYGNLLLSNTATACTVDFSSSHPRGLVRQAAVDEMQICNGSDPTISEEIKEKKKATGDQLSSKSKIANKKGVQRKLNMFSHEKWQIYGDETFKKFYQKMKKSELVKKTKQDTSDSKGIIGNEISLQPACELGKPSENLSSIPVIAPPTSSLQFTCSYEIPLASKEADTHLSIVNGHITLDIESNVQGKVSEAKFNSGINMCKGDMTVKQTVPKNVPTPSTGVCDNSNIVVMENQLKGHDHLEADADNFQIHERSPSDRKKIKVGGLKGDILYSVSLDFPEDTVDLQNKNVDCITDSGASTVVSCHSLSTIINKNMFLSQEDSGQIPAHSKKGQHVIPTTQSSSTLKEMLFSPRYLIKFNYAETSVDKSVLQSNQPTVCGRFSSDLINVTEDTNSKSLPAPTKVCHQTLLKKQPKLTQKHDSVIAPFGKISLNEECVPICCSSKISQNLVQNKSLDTQGSQYQKVRLDNTYLQRHNTFEDHRVVEDQISKHIDLKSSMSLISTDTMSTSEVNKLPQDPLLLDIIQPGENIWKPLNITGFLNQENSSFSTTCISSSSGIYSIKVTQVTFSTMNTEPKSTWCWLNRCLPLPAEQKEKSYSVYASLSSDDFKERKREPHGNRIEKDMSHMTTIDGQPMMSPKQKNCLKEETDKGIYHPLVKKSIMKSRHVKRSKDSTRGRSHSKMSQHKTTGALGQDQQHKKITCPSNLETGDILQRSANFDLSDKEGTKARIHHPTFHPGGDLSQKSEDKATPDSQMNEDSITTTVQEDNQSLQPMEKTTDLRPPRLASLPWQTSCLNALLTDNEVELHQHLSVCPPKNNVRKILHRSKTIGHSLGDDAVGSTSRMTYSESQPRLPVEAKDGIGRSSSQNTSSLGFHMAPNTHSSASSLEPGTLSLRHGEPSGRQSQSHKTQKKINLELMRKQTHVEYSDSSSDDEDRLYIEILE